MAKEFIIENKPLEYALLYCNTPDSSDGFEVNKYVPRIYKQYDRNKIDFGRKRRVGHTREISFKLIIR